jgi:hypothetical protein
LQRLAESSTCKRRGKRQGKERRGNTVGNAGKVDVQRVIEKAAVKTNNITLD